MKYDSKVCMQSRHAEFISASSRSKKAFALIELLVVVLIIGILGAVALPQYQQAVDRARLSGYLPVVADILKAEHLYYLENGSYSRIFRDLDLDLTKICPRLATNELRNCPSNVSLTIHVSPNTIDLDYCASSSCTYYTSHILRAKFSMASGKLLSCQDDGSDRGARLCSWLAVQWR